MVRRHGRRSVDPDAPVVDLDRVLADDRQIDLIGRRPWPDPGPARRDPVAGAHQVVGRHHRPSEHEPLMELLDHWRLELAGRPLPTLLVDAAPVRSTGARQRRRSWRPVAAAAAAIGAVIVGSATVAAADADPRSPWWPITQVLWPARAQSIESTQQIQVALAQARVALAAGRNDEARVAIATAAGELENIDDVVARDGFRSTVTLLRARSEQAVARPSTSPAAVPAGVSAAVDPPASAPGSAAAPGQVAAGVVGTPSAAMPAALPAALPGAVDAALRAPADPSGSSAPVAAGGSDPDTAAPPEPTGSAPSTSPVATMPDPGVVVEPPGPSALAESSASSRSDAPQQSPPAPPQTAEGAESPAGSSTPGLSPVTGGGDAQSPAAADEVQATSIADSAMSE